MLLDEPRLGPIAPSFDVAEDDVLHPAADGQGITVAIGITETNAETGVAIPPFWELEELQVLNMFINRELGQERGYGIL